MPPSLRRSMPPEWGFELLRQADCSFDDFIGANFLKVDDANSSYKLKADVCPAGTGMIDRFLTNNKNET